MAKRTTHRSVAVKKLYAVRDSRRRSKTFRPTSAHGADLMKKAKRRLRTPQRRSRNHRVVLPRRPGKA
jgi:hypothetical protein